MGVLNVDFNLLKSANVEVELITLNGKMVYHNSAGVLEAGWYSLPIQMGHIANGTYFLKLINGNNSTLRKVIKQ